MLGPGTGASRSRRRPENERPAAARAAPRAGRRRSDSRRRSARRGSRPGPESRRRPHGPPTRPLRGSARRRAALSARNVTVVVSEWSSSQSGVRRQRPETTSCVRPASVSSICAASAASRGLPISRPPQTTTVSTPSTGLPAAVDRPRLADGVSSGSPSGASTKSGATISNGIASCSRIARRCGDVDARTSGGVTRAFARPRSPRRATSSPTRPSRTRSSRASRRRRVPGARAAARSRSRWRAAGRSTRRAARWNSTPPSHSKRRMPNCGWTSRVADGHLVGRAEDHEGRVAQEHEPAAGPQQARGLGHPAVRVDPDRRAVLGDHQVGAAHRAARSRPRRLRSAGTRCRSRAIMPARRVELGRGDVDADRAARRAWRARPRSRRCRSRARRRPGPRRRRARSARTRRSPRCPTRSRRAPS